MTEILPRFPFIVLGGARCGTTLLKNLLRSHPDLISYSELFCPGRIYWDYPDMERLNAPDTIAWRDAHPVPFIQSVFGSDYDPNVRAVGFKLLYNQLFSPDLKPLARYLFALDGLRVVHIRRTNLFKMYVSRLIAAKRKERGATLNAASAADVETDIRVRADVDECAVFFRSTRDLEKRAREFFAMKPIIEVSYENITQNMQQEMAKVLEFLNVREAELTTTSHKVRSRPVAEVVENYAEIRESFSGSEYAEFFTD
ncbi:sulfotransferase [Desulfovibrio sp. JC010]|uniref:sulfotransferase n=1 Tax=Desulfovibrio sp. JC010 TaxID=2593641 RepID=UPI0013D1A6DB|nr:sulfotransferase [Desulfovibrio sp. JC010]